MLWTKMSPPIPPLRSTSETNDNSCCFKLYFKFLFSCSVVVFTMLIFRAVVLLFFSMSCRKHRRWHSRDPKLKHFLREHAPRLPQVWGAYGALTFLPLRAPSKSHATLLTSVDYWYLIAYEINVAQGLKKKL